jgi:hypothetical protein
MIGNCKSSIGWSKKKQAIEVKQEREWIGGEKLTNAICTLQLGRD